MNSSQSNATVIPTAHVPPAIPVQREIAELLHSEALLRLPQVLELVPISRSAWLAGVRSGKYPISIRISDNTVAWRVRDIVKLLISF